MSEETADEYFFNGVDAATGGYSTPPLTADALAAIAEGTSLDDYEKAVLDKLKRAGEAHRGVVEGVDPLDLASSGWAVIFPQVEPGSPEAKRQAAIHDALRPLIDRRRAQATRDDARFFKAFVGAEGIAPGTTKQKFLARSGAGTGAADPKLLPYYLLLVGSPEEIPFHLQAQLDVQYAVGRLDFDEVDDYARYAQSVVEAETRPPSLARTAAFFGVANPDDGATLLSEAQLIQPLYAEAVKNAGWTTTLDVGEAAKKDRLAALLGGADTPALLFTASHGMGFPNGDPRQTRHGGALLCQDWPGPKAWAEPIPEKFYFAADDLGGDARLHGSVAFHFACFGGGTPKHDEYLKRGTEIAPHAFVAGLPKRALAHPKGGLLASISHIGKAWGCSIQLAPNRGEQVGQLSPFESMLRALMKGHPVGAAMEYLNQRYAELATDLTGLIEAREWGGKVPNSQLVWAWLAHNDARGYGILGDPAVRLSTAEGAPAARAALDLGEVVTPTTAPPAAPAIDLDALEQAVIKVLGGATAAAVAAEHGLDAEALATQVATYRAAGRATLKP